MRTALTCLLYLIAVIGTAVAVDRVGADVLYGKGTGFAPAAESHYHTSVAQKLNQIEDGATEGRDPIFIGNSLTMLDIDAASFDRGASPDGAIQSYNLAIPSVGVTFWPEFFDRYWREPLPRNLLLGVQPRDVNKRGTALTQGFIERFFDEGQSGTELEDVAEDALSSLFTLWQRRGTLFSGEDPVPVGDAPGSTDITIVDDRGRGITAEPFVLSPAELRSKRAEEGSPGGPSFRMVEEAESALDWLEMQQSEANGKLILFSFPIYFDSEPEGAPGVERAFSQAMRDYAARRRDVEFIDAAKRFKSAFRVKDYVDENHLDRAAARRFSEELGRLLVGRLQTG